MENVALETALFVGKSWRDCDVGLFAIRVLNFRKFVHSLHHIVKCRSDY
jgi:hypothetical protein